MSNIVVDRQYSIRRLFTVSIIIKIINKYRTGNSSKSVGNNESNVE